MVLVILAVVVFGVASACGDDDRPVRACDPGTTQRCVCPEGEGAQVCAEDGARWGACSCAGPDASAAEDSGRRDDSGASPRDAALDSGPSDLDSGPIDDAGSSGSDASGADAGTSADAASDVGTPSGCGADAIVATVQEVARGDVGDAVAVRLEGVVAMSRLFLVSRSASTGSCLWGAFVSAPGIPETAQHTGLFVTSYGSPASIPPGGSTPRCPIPAMGEPTGSVIPDDVTPGDVLTLAGRTSSFLPSACAATAEGSTVPQRMLRDVCLATVAGTAPVPAAAVMSPTDLASLASPSDVAFHERWAGVRVRIADVAASAPPMAEACSAGPGRSLIDSFGGFVLDGSGLRVSSKLFYDGLLASLGDPCHALPQYCAARTPFHWDFIEGFSYLDFCTWSIVPDDKCADMRPPSADCTMASCAP